ncbi:FtsX-like permease family protein [Roseivirga sp.]|uniref:FtsX-like permease family protein n=1 Tax=Roseivirga sp. TaxID=1964215 RepID=UPI003B519314
MFRNFIISAWRSLKRQPYFSAINILGLSTGIAISILLLVFINHELRYDQFHTKKDNIYRVVSGYTTNDGYVAKTAISFGNLAPSLSSQVPGIANAVRILRGGQKDIIWNDNSYLSNTLLYTDDSFFDLFSYQSLTGPVSQESFNAGGLVMSKELAVSLFGQVPSDMKELVIDGKTYPLLAVIDVPKTSHLQFDILLSGQMEPDWDLLANESGLEFWTYLLYEKGADASAVTEQVEQIYDEAMAKRFASFVSDVHNTVQPLSDIHLYSSDISTSPERGNIETIRILAVIDVLILLIAIFNFINLSTVSFEKRIKEIGIRKVLGAYRQSLMKQYLIESVLLSLLSLVVSLLMVSLLIDPVGRALSIEASLSSLNLFYFAGILIAAAIVLGLLAGIYPALLVSSFNPNKILKGQAIHVKGKNMTTQIMVGLQFVIAIVLLINLGFFKLQMNYMISSNPGFNQEHVVVVDNMNEMLKENIDVIQSRLEQLPEIEQFAITQAVPGSGTSGQVAYLEGHDPNSAMGIAEIRTIKGFAETFEIPLVMGRDFDPSLKTDENAFMINEAAVKQLFSEGGNPINAQMVVGNRKGPIIGVMKDYHYQSLKYKIQPLMISLDHPYRMQLAVRANGSQMSQALNSLEDILVEVDPSYSMSYFFLDDSLEQLYSNEKRNTKLVSWSSLIASVLSLVGLVALTSFSISRKRREIAVRKVLGAEILNLNWILTRGFLTIILIANLIALPLGVWLSNSWLNDYAYRISGASSWYILPVAVALSLLIPLFLISFEVLKRSGENPAEVLRAE